MACGPPEEPGEGTGFGPWDRIRSMRGPRGGLVAETLLDPREPQADEARPFVVSIRNVHDRPMPFERRAIERAWASLSIRDDNGRPLPARPRPILVLPALLGRAGSEEPSTASRRAGLAVAIRVPTERFYDFLPPGHAVRPASAWCAATPASLPRRTARRCFRPAGSPPSPRPPRASRSIGGRPRPPGGRLEQLGRSGGRRLQSRRCRRAARARRGRLTRLPGATEARRFA